MPPLPPLDPCPSQWSDSYSNACSKVASHRRRVPSARSWFHGCDAIAAMSLAACVRAAGETPFALRVVTMASLTAGAISFGTG